jgi:hypothetical protein
MEESPQKPQPRIRMTAQLLREILDSFRDDIETLGMEEAMTEGEEAPDAVERAAIERVEGMLQSCADALLREVQALESRQLTPQTTADEELVDDKVSFDEEQHTEEEIAQHKTGLQVGLAGEPNDDTKTLDGSVDGRTRRNNLLC